MDKRPLEVRYAEHHSFIHHTFSDAKHVQKVVHKLKTTPHTVLGLKHALITHPHKHDATHQHEVVRQLSKLVRSQLRLQGKKLDVHKSHTKYLQTWHATHLDVHKLDLPQGKGSVREALTLAKKHFPAGTFSDVEHLLHFGPEQNAVDPLVYSTFAAAHDAFYFESLLKLLHKQFSLVEKLSTISNLHVHGLAFRYLSHLFDDELHAFAVLYHQGLHNELAISDE